MLILNMILMLTVVSGGLFPTAKAASVDPLSLTEHLLAESPQDEQEILDLLKSRDRQIKALLGPEGSEPTQDQRQDLKVIINGIIDFGVMAQQALGAAYDSVSDAQRVEFTGLFASIIRDQSLNKLEIYRAQVSYDTIRVDGDDARVVTTASYKEVRTPVSYAMRRSGTTWVITDMVIDDVSTVESYRRQFQSVIRKRGFDALMTSLRKRAERNEPSGDGDSAAALPGDASNVRSGRYGPLSTVR